MIAEALAPLATPLDRLTLLPGNPRRGDVAAVARSLNAFGQRKAIVANRDGTIIAGNHTYQAAQQLGWAEIAVVFVDDDDATAKAYALADNRTAELGGYDDEALIAYISQVQASDAELLAATGWSESDLALLMAGIEPIAPTPDVDLDAVPAYAPSITKAGDVWLLGPHRVMAGDCRSTADVDHLLAGATVNLAFTSPPYAEQRKYDESSGFKPIRPDAYVQWFADVAANVAANLADDGSWFVNIKPPAELLNTDLYVFDLIIAHVREWGWHFATELCWERNGVPKQVVRRFKNQFEPIYQFVRGDWKMRPDAVRHWSSMFPGKRGLNLRLTASGTSKDGATGQGQYKGEPRDSTHFADPQGKGGLDGDALGHLKRRKNGVKYAQHSMQGVSKDVGESIHAGLAYPGNRLPTFASTHQATGHTAAFPVGLPQWFVKAYTDAGDTVYDPFMGSGSTLLAANAEGRVGYGMEISPGYVDVICKRWQVATGIKPILEATGDAHDFCMDGPK